MRRTLSRKHNVPESVPTCVPTGDRGTYVVFEKVKDVGAKLPEGMICWHGSGCTEREQVRRTEKNL